MLSRTIERFRSQLAALPKPVQDKAASAYALWSANPEHPSLRFKKVHTTHPIYSVCIDRAWRAVGVVNGDNRTPICVTSSAHGGAGAGYLIRLGFYSP